MKLRCYLILLKLLVSFVSVIRIYKSSPDGVKRNPGLLSWIPPSAPSRLLLLLISFFTFISMVHATTRPLADVIDEAGLMTKEQARRIGEFHWLLLKNHDIDYRVQTSKRLDDINSYSNRRFEELKVGTLSHAGRGLLLVIDAENNRVRLEVSRALESAFPDAFIAYIEQRQMTAFFAASRVADGILATTELIVTRAQNAKANRSFDDETWAKASSSGAGAQTHARLHEGLDTTWRGGKDVSIKRSPKVESPETVLQAYFNAMAARNGNPNLDIYSQASRKMMQTWVVTAAQMDNVVSTYRSCQAQAVRINADGTHAVIRYSTQQRVCSPWFFIFENQAWRLDLTVMQTLIRFNHSNFWRFDKTAFESNPYFFAFTDWKFDRNGFPYER